MTKNEEAFLEHVAKKQGVTLEQVKRWPVSALEGYGAWQAATARAVGVLERMVQYKKDADSDLTNEDDPYGGMHEELEIEWLILQSAIKELSDG